MTKYLIVPLLKADHDTRVDDIEITADNCYALLNSVYQDCLVIDWALAKALSAMALEEKLIPFEKLLRQHRQASEKLMLQNMGSSGLGTFLKPGECLDPAEDCLIYSGLYQHYSPELSQQTDKGFSFSVGEEKVLIVAEGQVAGYLQHLPEAHTIPDDLLAQDAAAANLNKAAVWVSLTGLDAPLYLPLRCLIPKEPIRANTHALLLGFDYSSTYWFGREYAPLFFNHQGEPLESQPYLLALCTEKHGMTLAYATEKAVNEVCRQKYFSLNNTPIKFEAIEKYEPEKRFVSIKVENH